MCHMFLIVAPSTLYGHWPGQLNFGGSSSCVKYRMHPSLLDAGFEPVKFIQLCNRGVLFSIFMVKYFTEKV